MSYAKERIRSIWYMFPYAFCLASQSKFFSRKWYVFFNWVSFFVSLKPCQSPAFQHLSCMEACWIYFFYFFRRKSKFSRKTYIFLTVFLFITPLYLRKFHFQKKFLNKLIYLLPFDWQDGFLYGIYHTQKWEP